MILNTTNILPSIYSEFTLVTRDATATMRKHLVLESHANVDHIFLLGRDNISKPLSSKEIHFKQANNHHRLETLKAI